MVAQVKGIAQTLHGFGMLGQAGQRGQVNGVTEAKDKVIVGQANLTPGDGRGSCYYAPLEVDVHYLFCTKSDAGYHTTDRIENVKCLDGAGGC